MANPLEPGHLFGHVQDSTSFEVYHNFDRFDGEMEGKIHLPQPFLGDTKLATVHFEGLKPNFVLTKFMVIEVVVALVLAVVFIRLACRMRGGGAPKGRWWNLLESML